MTWRFDPAEIGSFLEGAGFDLDPPPAFLGAGGSITGRREREDAVIQIAIDGGGRVRATVTTRTEGPRRSLTMRFGLRLTSVDVDSRETTLSGRLRHIGDLEAVIGAIVSNAAAGGEASGR